MTPRRESFPITDDWRALVAGRLRELDMTQSALARTVGATGPTISLLMHGRLARSSLLPAIERALKLRPPGCSRCGGDHAAAVCPEPSPAPDDAEPADARTAAIAALRLESDAIGIERQQYDDLIRTCGLRIAAGRARQAEIAAEIARLRGGGAP